MTNSATTAIEPDTTMDSSSAPASSETPSSSAAGHGSHVQNVIAEWKSSWRQGAASLIIGSLCWSLYSTIASLFVEPFEQEFGWTRAEIAFVHGLTLVNAFAAPVIGRMSDHYGVRRVVLGGITLTGLGYLLMSLLWGSLGYYYAVYLFVSTVGLATSGITCTRIMSGAFETTRGTALAIGRSGLAIMGALMPLMLYPVIKNYGVMGGYLLLASLVICIALPVAWMWVPKAKVAKQGGKMVEQGKADSFLTLLRNRKVRTLVAAATLNYVPVVALLSQMKPLGVSKGLDELTAVGAVSVMAASAAVGAFLSGVLVDRFWAPAVAFTLNVAAGLGCLFLLQADVPVIMFYCAVMLVGLGQGAEIDIVAFMVARYFGLRSYSMIYSLTVLGISLFTSVGSMLIGLAYTHFGNYDVAIMVASALFMLAGLCYLGMGRYPDQIAD